MHLQTQSIIHFHTNLTPAASRNRTQLPAKTQTWPEISGGVSHQPPRQTVSKSRMLSLSNSLLLIAKPYQQIKLTTKRSIVVRFLFLSSIVFRVWFFIYFLT